MSILSFFRDSLYKFFYLCDLLSYDNSGLFSLFAFNKLYILTLHLNHDSLICVFSIFLWVWNLCHIGHIWILWFQSEKSLCVVQEIFLNSKSCHINDIWGFGQFPCYSFQPLLLNFRNRKEKITCKTNHNKFTQTTKLCGICKGFVLLFFFFTIVYILWLNPTS